MEFPGGPFITRLSNSVNNPDLVFAVGDRGVYRHTNFGVGRYPWDLIELGKSWAIGNQVTSAHNVKVSLADSSIVWAGGGMFRKPDLNVFVSTDFGQSFDTVSIYNGRDEMGYLTSIATHPTEPETAYLLFSIDHKPKILRTRNLGASWEDISGFGTDSTSSNGFPDVMVYSLLVFPYETNRIWGGTEIGIFESTDGGSSWQIANNGLPSVSVWQMFIQDDHVVVATHGRGIWTASEFPGAIEMDEPQNPQINTFPNPADNFINFEYSSDYFGTYTIKIYSLEGKFLYGQQGVKEYELLSELIDLSTFSPGNYLISFVMGNVKGSQVFSKR